MSPTVFGAIAVDQGSGGRLVQFARACRRGYLLSVESDPGPVAAASTRASTARRIGSGSNGQDDATRAKWGGQIGAVGRAWNAPSTLWLQSARLR
jgi:hypothetical protein